MRTPLTRILAAALGTALSVGFAVMGPSAAQASTAPAASAAAPSDFQQVTLAKGPDQVGEPMAMAVLPDGSVLHTSRDGALYDTTLDGITDVVARLNVYTHDEDGLQTVALDPHFAKNHWVYLYYAPRLDTPMTDAPDYGTAADFAPYNGHNQLSRFKFEDGKLDLSSEQKILQVNTSRGQCCHVAGDIHFDSQGNLLLSVGDDTDPFASDGYNPVDARPGRNPVYDDGRAAANTNDLRGKLLRIKVHDDGRYTVPTGNLFPKGTPRTRPEIYAMGFRNPFRFSVDQKTDIVYLADYGPDAGQADPKRGPENTVEYNRITKAGNFGWPYCIGDNTPYIKYDFATGTSSGEPFDCAHPVNDSPNNTGLKDLPPAQPAWIWNHYAGNPLFPELGGQGAPMGGPVYRYDAGLDSQVKFPQSYDGKFFAYEFGAHWIKPITSDAKGKIQAIDTLSDGKDWAHLVEPIDTAFGPDGSLYVLDYGSAWFGGSLDAGLYKIEYAPGDKAPTAAFTTDVSSGKAPLTVHFDGTGSTDPENDQLGYAWDFDNNGTVDSTSATPSYSYPDNGQYHARLTVTDPSGRTGTSAVVVTVGNSAPVLSFSSPSNGLTFSDGDQLAWSIDATDPDGTPVDCSKVQVDYSLGHDEHKHDLSQATGCSGTFTLTTAGHTDADNFYGIFSATYTDTSPTAGVPGLTGTTQIVLHSKSSQAEFFRSQSGVQTSSDANAQGAEAVTSVNNGDWIEFDPYDLHGVSAIDFRAAATGAGGTIEVHADSPDGPLLGSAAVGDTSGAYTTVSAPVTDPGGTHKLYFVFTGGSGDLFNLDAFTLK
ncbi:PQQ-dependent sugar dehydrogenase [Streptacidiphilus griseoplanus]|uniref:PQQ-dependent sugar dehydrogenase n=1 Tax=Peterkaempfera griseoplana TaxID=66896 RepID=UPI0006E3876B|nr:PQQ-dependent sugar dehydrogenase [Peterkaempfera griseoplana]